MCVRLHVFRRESSTCGWVGWLPSWSVGAEEGGVKTLREVGSLLGSRTTGKNYFYDVPVGHLSRYSLFCFCPLASLPCRRQHAPHKAFLKTVKSGGCSPPRMWGNVTQGQGFRITNCYPSVVRSMFRHFARGFGDSPRVQSCGRGGGGLVVHAPLSTCYVQW